MYIHQFLKNYVLLSEDKKFKRIHLLPLTSRQTVPTNNFLLFSDNDNEHLYLVLEIVLNFHMRFSITSRPRVVFTKSHRVWDLSLTE